MIVSDASIQDQRVCGYLQPLISSGEFVEKQQSFRLVGTGQEFGRKPHGLAADIVDIDRAADVDRLNRRQAKVNQWHIKVSCNLAHD